MTCAKAISPIAHYNHSHNYQMCKYITLVIFCLTLFNSANADTKTIYMEVGETQKLSPTELTSKVLQGKPAWTSSRPYDVEIIQTDMYTATIKAVKSFSGYAIIHCLYYFQELHPTNGTIIAQRSGYIDYNVFVDGGSNNNKPASISISPSTVNLSYGATKELTVTITPSGADTNITWSTTDASVTFVNTVNGIHVLGGNGYGTAVVTATTTNGLKASCTVTVGNNNTTTPPQAPPYSVDIAPEQRALLRIRALRDYVKSR